MPIMDLGPEEERRRQLRRLRSILEEAAGLAGQSEAELVSYLIEMALIQIDSDLDANREQSQTKA